MFFLFWTIEEEKNPHSGRQKCPERAVLKETSSSVIKSPGSFLECDERRRRIAKLASREG